jgi:ABC-type Fe3+/spermidine/putrescine transport system ATPase subunit
MTVFENVAFPLQLRGAPKSVIADKVERALDLVGLAGFGQRPATNLSGGQQQRVALARAIVYEPKLLLLDEPLSNLDAKLRERMRDELRALQRRLGIAVLFVTHDQAEAMVLSDRIAVLESGRIEQIGTPMTLYERPGTPFVRDFLGRVVTLEIAPSLSDARYAEVVGEPDALLQVSAALASNGRCMIACRPEDVLLTASHEAGPNWLSATVETAAYLGDRVEYAVRTVGGRSFTVFGPRREPHAIGASVALHIDTAGATLWPV